MIIRTAENCFWLQIHLLRAKSNAQFLVTCHDSYLDHNHSIHLLATHPLIVEAGFISNKNHTNFTYAQICERLSWDLECENSIYNNLKNARNNAHMIRVLLSEEAWVALNHLWLWLNEAETKQEYQKNRMEFYREIIDHYHRIQGIFDENMRRDNAFHFMQMGILLEKLESHSKILDLSLSFLIDEHIENEELFWRTILDAFDARDTFCSFYGQDITRTSTMSFLLLDQYFPHSIRFSINKLVESLSFVNWSKSPSLQTIRTLLNDLENDLTPDFSRYTTKLIAEIDLIYSDIREQYSKETYE